MVATRSPPPPPLGISRPFTRAIALQWIFGAMKFLHLNRQKVQCSAMRTKLRLPTQYKFYRSPPKQPSRSICCWSRYSRNSSISGLCGLGLFGKPGVSPQETKQGTLGLYRQTIKTGTHESHLWNSFFSSPHSWRFYLTRAAIR